MTERQKIIHLLNRATFGIELNSFENYQNLKVNDLVDLLFEESKTVEDLKTVSIKDYKFLVSFFDTEKFRANRRKERQGKLKLNNAWLNELIFSKAQLREKMSFFWHDHFACNVFNPIKTQKQINTIRNNALEYFGDLVVAISKDPAMNQYLNGQINVKQKPNENFAREILELFTLGEGNYTENDIQEAAKAFTGYGYDGKGNFYIYDDLHDKGKKTFMGATGNFNGDDIIDIILQNKNAGKYLVSKIYKYFTGLKITKERLKELNSIFYNSGYQIGKLLKVIFKSDWFYSEEIVGTKIKSPIELTVGLRRFLNIKIKKIAYVYLLQKKLDQTLFEPPNVSGWISDKNWIHLSTITERLTLAEGLIKNNPKKVIRNSKISDEGEGRKLIKPIKPNALHGIKIARKYTKKYFNKNEIIALSNLLFSCETKHITTKINNLQKQFNAKEISFADAITNLLSLPEYQLN